MDITANELQEWIAHFFWPFIRISAMLMTVSFFGARFVPARIRVYLSLAITIAIMPTISGVLPDVALLSISGFILIAEQIIIGVAMGLITQFISQTFVLLGQIIGMQSSLGFASLVDPVYGQNTPLLGQFYLFLATMLFLSTDGHLQLLQLLSLSFISLPIGESLLSADFRHIASWFGTLFSVALSMALVAIVALLTVNLSFGVMTRAAPQLNIFSLGFAFALLVGLLVSLYTLSSTLPYYQQHWQTGLNSICSIIRLDCGAG